MGAVKQKPIVVTRPLYGSCFVLFKATVIQYHELRTLNQRINPFYLLNLKFIHMTGAAKSLVRPRFDEDIASLGQVYSAYEQKFITAQMFKDGVDEQWVSGNSMEMRLISEENLSMKHATMGISAEISVTLMCVPLSITGSVGYYKETKKFAETQSADYYVKWVSGQTKIKNEMKCLPDIERVQALKNMDATHVVTGINYGARAFLKFESKLTDFVDDQKINGQVNASFERAMLKITGDAKVNIKEDCIEAVESKYLNYTGEFEGPTSMAWDSIIQWRDTLHEQKKNLNDGRGSPISYILTPIDVYMKQADIIIYQIGENYMREIQDQHEALTLIQQTFAQAIEVYEAEIPEIACDYLILDLKKILNEFKGKVDGYNADVTKALFELRKTGNPGQLIETGKKANESGLFLYSVGSRQALYKAKDFHQIVLKTQDQDHGYIWLTKMTQSLAQWFKMNNLQFCITYLYQQHGQNPQLNFFMDFANTYKMCIGNGFKIVLINIDSFGQLSEYKSNLLSETNHQRVLIMSNNYVDYNPAKMKQSNSQVLGALRMKLPFKKIQATSSLNDTINIPANTVQKMQQIQLDEFFAWKVQGHLNDIQLTKACELIISGEVYNLADIAFVFGTPTGMVSVTLDYDTLIKLIPPNGPKPDPMTYLLSQKVITMFERQLKYKIDQSAHISSTITDLQNYLKLENRQLDHGEYEILVAAKNQFLSFWFQSQTDPVLKVQADRFMNVLKMA